ncbi:hypothetical protein ACFYKX_03745 [Cytobacillus sp. FJAT-54145]|uniref:Lipoprotein n=1 Tax=Cytobacillus spartinae TaxID=3299023 RepID=A0ABW6K6B6_9BACI
MKYFYFGTLIAVLLLSLIGCQQNVAQSNNQSSNGAVEGFVEPEPSDWVEYTKPVREYMYYRTQAVLENNAHILWDQYPLLKENIDREKGLNVEKFEIESLNSGFELLDANFNIEGYERIKVKTINNSEAIVLVHGSIVYLRNDFEESGGEYLIKLFLKQEGNQWTVVKTDEYTLPEYKEWLKEKQ